MSLDALFAAANLLLPEVLLSHFDLTKHDIKGEAIHFCFTALNNIPEECANVKLHSKSFFPQGTVQDFPIRGKNVYLHIIRCRWLNKVAGKVVTRDWGLVTTGSRITSKFAIF